MKIEQGTLEPAFVLHRKPYRDTSLLLEIFTQQYGRIGVVAKGVRSKKSRTAALLQPFHPLLITYAGRGDLATLHSVESQGKALLIAGRPLFSGFYLNELLLRLTTRHDPHPELFERYHQVLAQLGSDNDEWQLRLFERDLLELLGYGLNLQSDSEHDAPLSPQQLYSYHFESGARAHNGQTSAVPLTHGETLLALASDEEQPTDRVLQESKRLMRWILSHYLGNRPLATREMFRKMYGKQPPKGDNEDGRD